MGHYSDQVWRAGFAQAESICMLSGMSIRAGDPVFRPRVQRLHVPINHNRMILASAIATLIAEPSSEENTEACEYRGSNRSS